MYETIEKKKTIWHETITTFSRKIYDCSELEVEAGTNGYCGGDSGHGSRTYFRIEDLGGTDIEARLIESRGNSNVGIEVVLGGDSELGSIKTALKFILEVLEEGSQK